MRTSRASFTAFLLLLAAGCSRSPAPAASPSPVASSSNRSSQGIPIQIDNQNFNEMNVYLVGNVGAMTKATLTIPPALAPADQRVRLRAEAIGGSGATTTPTLMVPSGQQVYWTIGSDPATSTASAG